MFLQKFALLGLVTSVSARVQYLGVAIAGGDFGCQIDGTCPTSSVQFASDAADQMKHFVSDGMNLMRLPTSWQFLVNNQLGGTLNANNLAKYDQLMQSCLSTGAFCMIDIHNFARWNGGIIGQGGPTDDQFVALWTQLATKYAANDKVVFELMNEPHDLDINIWTQTCQKVVTAIRNTGATSQMILLPGTNFDSAATLVSSGSAAALMGITNPDGSVDGLILDIHKYLDVDNSGTHTACVTDNVGNFTLVADFLRQNGRQGLISESGASSDASCMTAFCAQNTFINENSDVFLGFVAWAAGSFATSYVLSLTPSKSNNQYVDNKVMSQCVIAPWLNSNDTIVPSLTTASVPVASLIGTGTTVLLTSTLPLSTVTTLLVAPGSVTKPATALVSIATDSSQSTASSTTTTGSSTTTTTTTTTSTTTSGTSEATTGRVASSIALARLLLCGALAALFL